MPYWVAYRIGSFTLKELFDSHQAATSRVGMLYQHSFYAQVISAPPNDPVEARLLDCSIEMEPGQMLHGSREMVKRDASGSP